MPYWIGVSRTTSLTDNLLNFQALFAIVKKRSKFRTKGEIIPDAENRIQLLLHDKL
jgi:hypothetical protein